MKQGDYVTDPLGENIPSGKDPRLAARDRAVRRNKITEELFNEKFLNDENYGFVPDVRKAEVQYQVKSSNGS